MYFKEQKRLHNKLDGKPKMLGWTDKISRMIIVRFTCVCVEGGGGVEGGVCVYIYLNIYI